MLLEFWKVNSMLLVYHLSLQNLGCQLQTNQAHPMLSRFSHVWLFAPLWTIASQAPLSMGFSRQEYWSGLPFPPARHLPDPGIEPASPVSPALGGRFFTTSATWETLEAKCFRQWPLHLGLGSFWPQWQEATSFFSAAWVPLFARAALTQLIPQSPLASQPATFCSPQFAACRWTLLRPQQPQMEPFRRQ